MSGCRKPPNQTISEMFALNVTTYVGDMRSKVVQHGQPAAVITGRVRPKLIFRKLGLLLVGPKFSHRTHFYQTHVLIVYFRGVAISSF